NCNAPPYLPAVLHVVFETVPLLPFPDASVTVEPEPSSNPYAATKAAGLALAASAFCISAAGLLAPASTIWQWRGVRHLCAARARDRGLRSLAILASALCWRADRWWCARAFPRRSRAAASRECWQTTRGRATPRRDPTRLARWAWRPPPAVPRATVAPGRASPVATAALAARITATSQAKERRGERR